MLRGMLRGMHFRGMPGDGKPGRERAELCDQIFNSINSPAVTL